MPPVSGAVSLMSTVISAVSMPGHPGHVSGRLLVLALPGAVPATATGRAPATRYGFSGSPREDENPAASVPRRPAISARHPPENRRGRAYNVANVTRHAIQHEAQLVVIGSSAGGIEVLSRVVASLPADFPAPIVIAQHLDPRRPSHLHEILARHATLPVRVVEEREALEDGVIFVVPSNRLVEISHGDLRLRAAKAGAVAPSIDGLLQSAAGVFGPGLVAVILTGSGSDGSAGAWHVKDKGGAVVVEDPATAMFPSMPGSIPPSLVDATADLDAIGPIVFDLLTASTSSVATSDQAEFRALLGRIHDRSGIDFSPYKPATILRRLRGRMRATARPTLAAYGAYLDSEPGEYARLVNSLLIKVTEFFRDPKLFDYLREQVIPGLIAEARREQRELRLWSAGCSTGEEAYSLAMVVADVLGEGLAWPDIRIFATDVDREAISFARLGRYLPPALRSLPAGALERHFVKSGDGYEVGRRLRGLMVFGEHDLGERAPFPRIDLVLCRNVLIYFTAPMQQVALETFAFSLRTGGRLVLGASESTLALPEPYEEENARLRVYRRREGSYSIPPTLPSVPRARRAPDSRLDQAVRGTHRDVRRVTEASVSAESLLLDLSVGIVVVDPRYDITRINTAARKMLGIHGTAYDQDFIHLAEVLPPGPIRAAIDSAIGGRTTSAVFEVEPEDAASETTHFVETVIRPYRTTPSTIDGVTLELRDVTRLEQERRAELRTQQRLQKAIATNGRLLRANQELTALVAQLRTSNESMLLSSEDAQATREEAETVNEEFQATNEELETLNEELTASVEELRVANEDLATRTEELSAQATQLETQKLSLEEEHERLRSILASLGDAVVAVDHEGRIVTTNAAYDRLFGEADMSPEDAAGIPIPVADQPLHRASRGERFRMEFAIPQAGGTRGWFEAVAEPLTAEDRTWGGVVTIRDLSERTMRLSLERLMAAAGHELKTPVAALHGYLQLVERSLSEEGPAPARAYAARGLVQTRQIGELVERLFDVSRIQAGRFDLVTAPVGLAAVVRRAVEVAEILLNAPSISISAPRGEMLVRADSGRLEQVFVNLLSNAVEHAAASPTVEVTIRRSGQVAVVQVRDHGPGIAASLLPMLFQPYTRLGQKHSAGLGLGLYLAREIVTAHGGTIEANSTAGVGTTITVRLPLHQPRARKGARRPAQAMP
jgi:two-component system, chemotaxis family, CheB/CheR fusion protein